jgi:hypothetical protein
VGTKVIVGVTVTPMRTYVIATTMLHLNHHSSKLTGANFESTSEVLTPVVLEWLKLRYKKYGVEVTFNDMISLLNFMKLYQLFQKL